MSLHPIMAQALASWMPKPELAITEHTNAAVTALTVPTMAEQLREEYASGLDAVPPGRDWEPEQ